MNISWQDLNVLNTVNKPAGYLKMMSEVWGIKVRSIVEIGVFQGTTSEELKILFPDAFLYLIDPWEMYEAYLSKEAGPISKNSADYESAYQLVKKAFDQDPKVKIIRKTSLDALEDVPEEIDLVFIDGNHDYAHVKQDIEHWLPKIRSGGMISGHDYRNEFPGVRKAVDAFFPEGVAIGSDHVWLRRVP